MLATALKPALEAKADLSASFVEAMLSELHYEALSITMVASAACSLQRRDATIDIAMLTMEAPEVGPLLDLLACTEMGEAPGIFVFDGLDAYAAAVSHAVDCLGQFAADVHKIGYVRASAVHALSMSESWCAAARAAETVVASSFAALPVAVGETYHENVFVLCSLLRSAASGMRPCLDDNHRLVRPHLPQQRRWPRKPLMEDCQLRPATACSKSASWISLGVAPAWHTYPH